MRIASFTWSKSLSLTDKDTVYPGLFPSVYESHGGDDVAVFAAGTYRIFTKYANANQIY